MRWLSKFVLLLLLISGLCFTSCKSTKQTERKKDRTEKVSKKKKEKKDKDLTDDTVTKANREAEQKLKLKYAEILGVNDRQLQNIALIKFVDEWQGVPYKYGGGNKSGVDCSNFTSLLYENVFSKKIIGNSAQLAELTAPVKESNYKEGDLLFFKIKGDKISHVGVYLINNKFVHATTSKGVMINDLSETYYKKYFIKAGRIISN
jgi:murein DD-endopeptidase / murein LD-carboxypeptidase